MVWSGDRFVSSFLTDSGERPRLSSISFRLLKRFLVSVDHSETPALPSALTRTNNRHAMYPSTRLVEIHADKAARSTMSKPRNVPGRKICKPGPQKSICEQRTRQPNDKRRRGEGGAQTRESSRCDNKCDKTTAEILMSVAGPVLSRDVGRTETKGTGG